MAVLPIGCLPGEVSARGKPGSLCVKEENEAVVPFNEELKSSVDLFNKEFPDSKFIYIDTAAAILTEKTKDIQGNNNLKIWEKKNEMFIENLLVMQVL